MIATLGCIGLFIAACSSDGGSGDQGVDAPNRQTPGQENGAASPGGGSPSSTSTTAAPACDFTPANAVGCESGPRADLAAECDSLEIDTTSGKFACGIAAPSKLVDQGPGNPKIRVFYVNGLHIARDTKVTVTGTNALAIVSRGDAVLEGVIDASAPNQKCLAGPGGYRGGDGASTKGGNGGGPGGGIGATYAAGAGGGSFGGLGGAGGDDNGGSTTASGAAPGAAYGTTALVPLIGGSGGGADMNCGGGGGGAVQIVSSTSILVANGGGINAGGASSDGYYGGGGSGGAILVEAPKVTVQGTVAANGGGGGYGCGGELASTPACGGSQYNSGIGSSGIDGNGAPGATNDGAGGGGGGGAGRIRIVTHASAADVAGIVSPAFSTSLSTQAELPK